VFRRTGRLLPLLAAALLIGLFATASPASAARISEHCTGNQYSAWDEQWLMMSIEGDRFEIQGGKLAQSKAKATVVRDLGARLVKDHTKSLTDAAALARQLGISVPGSPSPTQQWQLRVVGSFAGTPFDQWYSDLEIRDHEQDITEAKDEVDKGCNPKVRQNARNELPTLRTHLALARKAQSEVGKPPSARG
jgi:putative membrane protein